MIQVGPFFITLDLQCTVHISRWKEKLATQLVNTLLFRQFNQKGYCSLC